MRSRDLGHQRLINLWTESLGFLVFFASQCLRNKVFNAMLVGPYLHLMLGKFSRQQSGYTLIDFGYIVLAERNVGTVHIGEQLQSLAFYSYGINLYTTYSNFLAGNIVQQFSNLLTDICRQFLCTAYLWKQGSSQQCIFDLTFHIVNLKLFVFLDQ